jgi:hypothetical protein
MIAGNSRLQLGPNVNLVQRVATTPTRTVLLDGFHTAPVHLARTAPSLQAKVRQAWQRARFAPPAQPRKNRQAIELASASPVFHAQIGSVPAQTAKVLAALIAKKTSGKWSQGSSGHSRRPRRCRSTKPLLRIWSCRMTTAGT